MSRHRIPASVPSFLYLILLLGSLALPMAQLRAQEHGADVGHGAAQAAGHGATDEGAGHEGGWTQTTAKIVNFAVLVGVLGYFLRAPIADYLRTRSETIRRDLVDARTLRTAAEAQLSSVRDRLAALPGELAALEARGRDELSGERERLAAATQAAREKIVEGTRREIDIQYRSARRALVEHTAALAMDLARTRIERAITPADQQRLVDRYATEVRS